MSLYWQDNLRTVYNGSCRSMTELTDESVQMCVTSPPYWGLRKYAGEQDIPEWGCSYGLEKTLDLYVQHSIEILREIRRVLRKDGVVFWNIGDSYAGSGKGIGTKAPRKEVFSDEDMAPPQKCEVAAKNLCLIPFRVAIAAQDDGWWVRSDIIWDKPNPMPESVTDRPTDAYEHILMFTKSARYYWDMEAVREKADYDGRHDTIMKPIGKYDDRNHMVDGTNANSAHSRGCERWPNQLDGSPARNLRNVWRFPTLPYSGAHFATFPPELPSRCIKAATPEYGCCDKCGKPYERIVDVYQTRHDGVTFNKAKDDLNDNTNRLALVRQHLRENGMENKPETKTLGWKQACKCEGSNPVPSVVLDPFCGSGTTLKVAAELGRKAIGYEISKEYCELIVNRNRQSCLSGTE